MKPQTELVDSAQWQNVEDDETLITLLTEFISEQIEKGLAKPGTVALEAQMLPNGRLRIDLSDGTYVELFTLPASVH